MNIINNLLEITFFAGSYTPQVKENSKLNATLLILLTKFHLSQCRETTQKLCWVLFRMEVKRLNITMNLLK